MTMITEDQSKKQNPSTQLPSDRAPKKLSREIGLEIGSLFGRHFLKIKHLHYGYWPGDLEVDITNLHIAQDRYIEFLISNIPQNVKNILDVGCGSGQNAKKLIEAGYNVDCVSPSPVLAEYTQDAIGSEHTVYVSYYEELMADKQYDMIMFSESFQYMDMEQAIEKTRQLLNKDGCLLICDIFKNDVEGKCTLSGGHRFSDFNEIISKSPFVPEKEIDITDKTAPTIDIEHKMFMEVGLPAWGLLDQLMDSRYPLMAKFVRWKYKKKIGRLKKKYFDGQRTGANFRKFKSYKLLVYKMNAAGQ
jgi:SAM-dependent methyltransferase